MGRSFKADLRLSIYTDMLPEWWAHQVWQNLSKLLINPPPPPRSRLPPSSSYNVNVKDSTEHTMLLILSPCLETEILFSNKYIWSTAFFCFDIFYQWCFKNRTIDMYKTLIVLKVRTVIFIFEYFVFMKVNSRYTSCFCQCIQFHLDH